MQATQNNIRLARIRGRIEAAEDPVRVLAEEYDQGDADTQDALRTVWEAKFANRAEDPGMADRRFDQNLSVTDDRCHVDPTGQYESLTS
jgi:hypothetical protein